MTHPEIIKESGITFTSLNDEDLRDRGWREMENGKRRRVDRNDKSHPSCNSLKC